VWFDPGYSMSEYQYYEWQTIDRLLTEAEILDVNNLSSHMDVVTPTQAIVTYSWGDFKHDPYQVLLAYFDAFFYQANWGTTRLMFRFPKGTIDLAGIRPYTQHDFFTLHENSTHYVLEFSVNEEEGLGWIEGEGSLSQLIPLREQIMQGDYRLLYLMWLKAISSGAAYYDEGADWDEDDEDDEDLGWGNGGRGKHLFHEPVEGEEEPPVPPGLQNLTGSLGYFIKEFGVDPYLVQAASRASDEQLVVDTALQQTLSRLSRAECEEFLWRLLENEPQVRHSLRQRLLDLAGIEKKVSTLARRTAGDLAQAAEQLYQEAERQAQDEARRKRIADLETLAGHEETTWQLVDSLIGQKQGRPYDEATSQLVKLRELAVYQNRLEDFQNRFDQLKTRFSSRYSLMERFRSAGLM
jgi:hypothetical protein